MAAPAPRNFAPDAAPLPVEKWAAAWDAIAEGLSAVNVALADQNRQIAELDKRIAALEQATPRVPRPGAPLRDLVIAVDAGAPTKGSLRVTYRVPGAGWTPVYDIRLTTGTVRRPSPPSTSSAAPASPSGPARTGRTSRCPSPPSAPRAAPPRRSRTRCW